MTLDINQLERLAVAATPGPWIPLPSGSPKWVTAVGPTADDWRTNRDNDAAFVAAANPQTVLALIARVRELAAHATNRSWER